MKIFAVLLFICPVISNCKNIVDQLQFDLQSKESVNKDAPTKFDVIQDELEDLFEEEKQLVREIKDYVGDTRKKDKVGGDESEINAYYGYTGEEEKFVSGGDGGRKRAFGGQRINKWPKNSNGELIIPYVIHNSIPYGSDKYRRIKFFIAQLNSYIKCNENVWRPRTNQKDYVVFVNSLSCSSYIGRVFNNQTINLADGCVMWNNGTVLHEMLHAMGIYHEHQRRDRDKYVEIVKENLIKGTEHNFNKKEENQNNTLPPYDYGSVMHYGEYAFSMERNVKKTIVKLNLTNTDEMGQRHGLSYLDKKHINSFYECNPETSQSTMTSPTASMTTQPNTPTTSQISTTISTTSNPTTTEEATTEKKIPTTTEMTTTEEIFESTTTEPLTTTETIYTEETFESTTNGPFTTEELTTTETVTTSKPTIDVVLSECKLWRSSIHQRNCSFVGFQVKQLANNCVDRFGRCQQWLSNRPTGCSWLTYKMWCRKSCGLCDLEKYLDATSRYMWYKTIRFEYFRDYCSSADLTWWEKTFCFVWRRKKVPSSVVMSIPEKTVKKQTGCTCDHQWCGQTYCVSITHRRQMNKGRYRHKMSESKASVCVVNMDDDVLTHQKTGKVKDMCTEENTHAIHDHANGEWERTMIEFYGKCSGVEVAVNVTKGGRDSFQIKNITVTAGLCPFDDDTPTKDMPASDDALKLFDVPADDDAPNEVPSNDEDPIEKQLNIQVKLDELSHRLDDIKKALKKRS